MSVNNYDQNVQRALDDVNKRYKDIETWIADMEADKEDIQNQLQHLHNTYWWGWSINHNATNAINSDKADISALADQIANASGGSTGPFANLLDAIKDCVNADGAGGLNTGNQTNFVDDMTAVCTALTSLVAALNQRVAVQEDEEAIALLNQNPNGANSNDVMVLIQKLIGDQGQESITLESLTSNLNDALKNYQSQYNNASNDENDIHWWDWLNPWTIQRKNDDDANKDYATKMMTLIQTIKTDITPELASLTPDFMQVSCMINQILDRLTKILAEKLPPAERNQELMKLNSEIMDLFVMIIGLLSLVQQDATKDKAKNEAVMSKATSLAAEMGIANSQAEAVKVAQDMAYSKNMQTLMTIAKIVMEAVSLVAAPGFGGLLVAALMIILDRAGVFDLLTNAIEKALENDKALSPEARKIIADVIVGVIEMAATMGGGAILDALLKNVMEAVLQTVSTAIKETIETATKDAVKAVDKALGEALKDASKMMKPTLEIAAKKAAEQAAKKVFVAIMERNGLRLLLELGKESITGGIGRAMERMVEKTMIAAAQDAAEQAVLEAGKIIGLAGKIAGTSADQIMAQITKAAEVAGDAAAAKALDMSLEDIAKLTIREGILDGVRAAARRGGFTALYAIGTTNLLVDIIKAAHDAKKLDDKAYRTLLGVMEALQAILTLIGQLGGTGAAAQFMNGSGGINAVIMKLTNILAPLATAAEGVASGSMYEIDANLATAKTRMLKLQTVLDILMQFLSKQIDVRRKQESKHDTAEFEMQMKSNFNVASHLYDYLNTSAQVMV